MRYLLDTNVLSELVRPEPDARVVTWLEARPPLDLAISVLTLGELTRGVRLLSAGRRRAALERWIAVDLAQQFRGRLLVVNDAVTVAWGGLAAEARHAGRTLPVIDGLLLATAAVHALTLVTRNTADCGERGVPVWNPWDWTEGGTGG